MKLLPPRVMAAALCGLCISGCSRHVERTSDVAVVTTTTVLGDFVREIGGKYVGVRVIVPVGASVESYEPSPQDIAAVHDAKLIVENGAGLEHWLDPLIANAKAEEVRSVVASDGLPLINRNAHLWMDPLMARRYVRSIRDGLGNVDPKHRVDYERNAKIYDAKLVALTREVARRIAVVPKSRRVMLVYHDAWQYYGRRFGLRILGVVEQAPGREPDAASIARLVDLARAGGSTVVFTEPEESAGIAEALATSIPHGKVVPLAVDTLTAGGPNASYLSMIRTDTDAIVAALK